MKSKNMLNAETGQIITFYSFKGGIGRTMAVANIGCLLAGMDISNGTSNIHKARVLAIDWDLEAPGLHRYFQPYLKNETARSFDSKPGCLELFEEANKRRNEYDPSNFAENRERSYNFFKSLNLYDYLVGTNVQGLNLMKAGRYDESYGKRVSEFRWDELFLKTVGLFSGFSDFLHEEFDFVIIDSRTGVADTSGICTMLLPDKLVLVFTHNLQSLTGVKELAVKAVNYRKNSFESRPLIVFPLPSHIETSIPNKMERWRMGSNIASLLSSVGLSEDVNGYQPFFEYLLCNLYGKEQINLNKYFDQAIIKYVPDYAFGEPLAAELELSGTRDLLKKSYDTFKELLIELPAPWLSIEDVQEERELLVLCEDAATKISRGRISEAIFVANEILETRIHIENLKETINILNRVVQGAFPHYREEAINIAKNISTIIDPFIHDKLDHTAFTASLLEEIANVALKFCAYDVAQEFFCKIFNIFSKELGADNRNTLRTEIGLSTILIGKGDYFRAFTEIKGTCDRCKEALGHQDSDTLSAFTVLANVHYSLGEYKEAEALYRKVLSRRESLLDADHPELRSCANYLASLLIERERYKEADALVSRMLEGRSLFQDEDTETLISFAYKALLLAYANSNYHEAYSLLNEVISARTKILGNDHPDTITTYSYKADIVFAQGNKSEALPILLDVISRRNKILGFEHPATLSAQKALALFYDKINRPQEAVNILSTILPALQKKLGTKHPSVQQTKEALARIIKDINLIRHKA